MNAEEGDIDIRAFSSDDYKDVIALWRSCGLTIKASDSLPELEKLCAIAPNRLLVAESNNEAGTKYIIGAVIGAFDGRRAWIYHLAVLPNVRRGGVATRLVREIERHLRASGALKVNLLVEPENIDACRFYKALGFSEAPFAFFTKEL
jgi:ribosomal protein S18 acetylase RimI-like enzyme